MAVGELDIDRLRAGHTPTRAELVRIVILLSVPMILSEISVQVMSYIDAGMVGSLGPVATASVGLVNTTDWLMSGMCFCVSMGFNVQIAQLVGAGMPFSSSAISSLDMSEAPMRRPMRTARVILQ